MKNKQIRFKTATKIADATTTFSDNLISLLDTLRQEMEAKLLSEKKDLLLQISEKYDIDHDDLLSEYLNIKLELNTNKDTNTSKHITIDNNNKVLSLINIKGIIYYYENKEDGDIYDPTETPVKIVGKYINGKHILEKKISK
jgi:predicted component of viral defense system (DUF524 family)